MYDIEFHYFKQDPKVPLKDEKLRLREKDESLSKYYLNVANNKKNEKFQQSH